MRRCAIHPAHLPPEQTVGEKLAKLSNVACIPYTWTQEGVEDILEVHFTDAEWKEFVLNFYDGWFDNHTDQMINDSFIDWALDEVQRMGLMTTALHPFYHPKPSHFEYIGTDDYGRFLFLDRENKRRLVDVDCVLYTMTGEGEPLHPTQHETPGYTCEDCGAFILALDDVHGTVCEGCNRVWCWECVVARDYRCDCKEALYIGVKYTAIHPEHLKPYCILCGSTKNLFEYDCCGCGKTVCTVCEKADETSPGTPFPHVPGALQEVCQREGCGMCYNVPCGCVNKYMRWGGDGIGYICKEHTARKSFSAIHPLHRKGPVTFRIDVLKLLRKSFWPQKTRCGNCGEKFDHFGSTDRYDQVECPHCHDLTIAPLYADNVLLYVRSFGDDYHRWTRYLWDGMNVSGWDQEPRRKWLEAVGIKVESGKPTRTGDPLNPEVWHLEVGSWDGLYAFEGGLPSTIKELLYESVMELSRDKRLKSVRYAALHPAHRIGKREKCVRRPIGFTTLDKHLWRGHEPRLDYSMAGKLTLVCVKCDSPLEVWWFSEDKDIEREIEILSPHVGHELSVYGESTPDGRECDYLFCDDCGYEIYGDWRPVSYILHAAIHPKQLHPWKPPEVEVFEDAIEFGDTYWEQVDWEDDSALIPKILRALVDYYRDKKCHPSSIPGFKYIEIDSDHVAIRDGPFDETDEDRQRTGEIVYWDHAEWEDDPNLLTTIAVTIKTFFEDGPWALRDTISRSAIHPEHLKPYFKTGEGHPEDIWEPRPGVLGEHFEVGKLSDLKVFGTELEIIDQDGKVDRLSFKHGVCDLDTSYGSSLELDDDLEVFYEPWHGSRGTYVIIIPDKYIRTKTTMSGQMWGYLMTEGSTIRVARKSCSAIHPVQLRSRGFDESEAAMYLYDNALVAGIWLRSDVEDKYKIKLTDGQWDECIRQFNKSVDSGDIEFLIETILQDMGLL